MSICKDRSHLNGMGYVYYYSKDELSPVLAAEMMKRLNVKSVRLWTHIPWLLRDSETVNRPIADEFHNMYAEMLKAGVTQLVGMSHYWFFPDSLNVLAEELSQLPRRDITEGSSYQKFLELYEQSWYTLVKEFPEVTDWETGNEYNHKVFIAPLVKQGEEPGIFTMAERADICTDLMFRSARAVHAANPGAGIIMPGMAPVSEQGDGVFFTSIAAEYSGFHDTLTRIYKNIRSGQFGSENPRDFFDYLCWHPYYAEQRDDGSWHWKIPDSDWVALNRQVYEIAVKAGDPEVGCCLSEFGFNDGGTDEGDEAFIPHVQEGFRLIREEMPFVDTVHAYRFFDSMGYVTQDRDHYSFFTMKNGKLTGKKKAIALQEQYGGSGNLTEE